MTTMTTEELVARRVYVSEQIARLTDEKSQIDEKLRESNTIGKTSAGDWTLTLSPNRRFDDKSFAQKFPVAIYPHFYTAKPDITQVKQFIPPVELDQWYIDGQPIVKVA